MRQVEIKTPAGRKIGKGPRKDAMNHVARATMRRGGASRPKAAAAQLGLPTLPGASPLGGVSFSSVFERQPNEECVNRWRVKGSGVHERPETAVNTRQILRLLRGLKLDIMQDMGGFSPGANVCSWDLECVLLDGKVTTMTGNYWFGEKGAWICGAKALLFIALKIGVVVPTPLRQELGVDGITIEELTREVLETQRIESTRGGTNHV